MAYLLDGALVLLFAGMIYLGYRQGIIRTLSGVISFVAALVLTTMLTAPVTDIVYQQVIQPTVVEKLDAQLGDGSPAAEKVDAALEQMPAFITNQLSASGVKNGADLLTWLGDADKDVSSVEWLADKGIRPFVYPVVEALCSLALFVVLDLVLTLLLSMLDKVAKFTSLEKANKWLGLAAGVIQGALWVLLIVGILDIVNNSEMVPFINEEMLDSTLLTGWLRSVNPLGDALREFFSFA